MWIKDFLLNIFFPVHCLGCKQQGFLICQSCLDKILILGKRKSNIHNLDRLVFALDYRQPLVKKIIKSFKYSPFARSLVKDLTPLLIKFLKQSPEIITYLTKNNFILIPIPLSKRKLAIRGFNQAELIAQELANEFNWLLNSTILKKVKNNRSQSNLTREQRRINVQDVFGVAKKKPGLKNIILVDDIFTTGATLAQAAKTLKQTGGQKIWAIVLAKG